MEALCEGHLVPCCRQSFIEEKVVLHDEQRSGRSSSYRNTNAVEDIWRVVDLDQHIKLDEILAQLSPNIEISYASIHGVITDGLCVNKSVQDGFTNCFQNNSKKRVDAAL